MFPETNLEAKTQGTPSDKLLSEPEFLESPFDRWLHLADVIIEKHSHPEKPQPFSGRGLRSRV